MNEYDEKDKTSESEEQQYSLNDDRRVKVLSPNALVMKRFFRNKVAVVGLVILVFMFLFSFLGGVISPYDQDQFFYREEAMSREFAVVTENKEYRYVAANPEVFNSIIQAQMNLGIQTKSDTFSYKDVVYELKEEGENLYGAYLNGEMIGIAYMDVITASTENKTFPFEFMYNALLAYTNGENSFKAEGANYTIDDEGGINSAGTEVAYISRYVVKPIMNDVFLSRDFKEKLVEAIENGETEFTYTDENLVSEEMETEEPVDEELLDAIEQVEGEDAAEEAEEAAASATATYTIQRGMNHQNWSIKQETMTRRYDTYSYPSKEHPLGTDKYGMDMLTRLMYGGRVSLIIGFIVVIIETLLGVVMGGLAGYFGGWVDNLVMRIVDVFYCIPSTPIIIILGAAMDAQRVDPSIRMLYLMLILGVLGWAGVARMVRGQILSLREQEFMTAAEATGLRASKRIFKHLIPNVLPQLIVNCTMGLGSVIIMEATLSFLGLGVKFPFASWGNIINDVNNTFVLTTYWFIWIPAGVLLLLTVLAFNLVGDGLRDAFDPKMKR